jgi:glycosyltransferase involved in cell wall biosynthesis
VPDSSLSLVHASTPPVPGGTNVVLTRLLARGDTGSLDVFTDRVHRKLVRANGDASLPGRYRYFFRVGGKTAYYPLLRPVGDLVDLPLALVAGLRVAFTRPRSRPGVVMSVVDSGFSIIAGSVAARLLRRPHLVMVFDLWEENAYSGVARKTAKLLEGRILRSAGTVVVFCGQAAEHYRRKHGVTCEVLDTPIEPAADGRSPDRDPDLPLEILVGGAIYWAQEDAVRRLLRVAARVPEVRVTILGDEASLRARGIQADAYEPRLSERHFEERVRHADVLFLGLSLESRHPDVIRTATPARLPEYMASGRPLLLHAPAGSHVAAYARAEDFAEVVDAADETALERGIRSIVDDPGRASARAARAARLARERHEADRVRRKLRSILRNTANR